MGFGRLMLFCCDSFLLFRSKVFLLMFRKERIVLMYIRF